MLRVDPKKCVSVFEKCPGWDQKMSSVSRRIFVGGNQKLRLYAGEIVRVRPKKGVRVLENF
jgi:hypothetical protein